MGDFYQDRLLAAAGPKGQAGGLGKDVTLREAIVASLAWIEKDFAGQRLVEAGMRMTLGAAFNNLGEPKRAFEQIERARALYAQRFGPDDRRTLGSLCNLATCYHAAGRPQEALALSEEALATRRHRAGGGPDAAIGAVEWP